MADPQIPQAFEEATDTPVIIGTDPAVSPLPTLMAGEKDETIPDAAREDVTVQQEGVDFKEVLAGNVPKVGSLNVTPKLLDAAKKNPAIMRRLKAQHTIAGQAAGEDQVVIPMMRQGEFVPPPEIISDPKKLSKAERVAMGRKAVDDLLVQQGITDPTVRQVFVDDFQTGEFYNSLNNRLAQAGEFIGTAIPAGSILAFNAATAAIDAYSKGTDWSAEWGARQNGIKQSFKVMRDAYANVNMPTIARSYNDYIASELDKKLEDGTITQERYDEAMFITNEDGDKVRREFITEEQAATMMDLAFEELPTVEKFGVIFAETALGMVGPGQTRGVLAMQKFNRLVKKNPVGTEVGDILRTMDPIEAVDTLKHMGVKTGINRNALSIGVMQQRMDKSLDTLATQIDEAGEKLDMLRIQGVPKSSTQYKVAAGDYSNLKQRMLRAKYTARAYPYVKEAGTDALVISAGQLAAREWLPEYTDLSPETSEVIGAIFMIAGGHQATQALGGKVIQMTSSPRVGGPRVAGSTMEFLANAVTLGALGSATVDAAGNVTPGSPFRLTDQTISDFEKAIGKKLTVDELKGVRASIDMVNNLTPNEREVVLGALGDYNELRNRIVNSFPTELQGRASDLFSQSFSNATGLTFLSAVNAVNTNRLDIRNLSNLELSSVYKQQMAANKQVEMAEMAINNLDNLIQEAGIQDPEAVTSFILANRQALKTYRANQTKTAEQQLAILQDIRTNMLGDPTFDIPEDFVTDLTEADSVLRETLGQVVDKREQVRGIMTDLFNGLSERMAILRGQRGRGKQYYRNIGRAAEDVIDTQIDAVWNMGRAAYDNVRKVSQGQPPIDLSDSVEFLLEQAGETNYERFFSPEGQFFSGKLGRQNYIVFDEMVTRALPNVDELRTFLKTGGTLPDGTEVAGLSQELVDGMTNLELAMELKRIQPDFQPFSQLNAYEVDVMRRTFRDYAYKIQDGALTSTYENYAGTLDKAIATQNPEVYGVLKEARATYASEVGDRLRPGSFLYKIDTSRQARVRTATGEDMFQYAYKGVNPLNLFSGVSDNLTKALRGDFKAEGQIIAEVGAIATQFGDTIDGKRVFDLTTPAGQAKFAALQNAVGEKVYADWADGQIKAFERVSGLEAIKQGGYKLDNLADIDTVHSLMMVNVKTADGIVQRPLVNLYSIYSDHRNLNDFVAGSEKARKEYAEFISEFNNVDSKLRVNIQNNIKAQDDAFDELSAFTGGLNADAFYQRFILDSSPAEVEYMRDMFVKSQVKAGSRSADEATQMFDSAVGRLIAKGFLNRAGVAPVSGALPAFLHDVPAARQFNTPEVLLDDLRDHREQLEAILGEEHVSYLEDISRFLSSSKEQSIGLDGKVSGYSLNEGLSRLYNVSRGMVSPLYVSSEFAVRLMARANIDVLELAAGNEQAAEIISKMFSAPETVTLPQMKTFFVALSEFAFTELAREDMFAPELNEMFLLPEEEESNEQE